MELVKDLRCNLLQKKVNGLQPKISSAKKSTLDVREGLNEYQTLLWWILHPAPSLITHSSDPTIKLPRIQIFKTGFRKLSILSKFSERCKWHGVGGHLVLVIMMHYVRKSICDLPLLTNKPIPIAKNGKISWAYLQCSESGL